jgi:lipoprotein-anchoring transpeptidase ErfK/SrfK
MIWANGSAKANRNRNRVLTAITVAIAVQCLNAAAFAQDVTQRSAVTGTGLLRRVVVVSIPDRKLAVLDEGSVIATFPIAVGAKGSPSPSGDFLIVSRLANPTYYHPGTVIAPGKDNPVGTRWLGLSQRGYGIHGTNAPRSIGHAASHGCIRLRNRDMERLFTMLQVGDVVQIRGERDEQITEIFGGAEGNIVADAQPGQVDGQ